jgi:hypothetical protein
MKLKLCKWCFKEFLADPSNIKYCSDECRLKGLHLLKSINEKTEHAEQFRKASKKWKIKNKERINKSHIKYYDKVCIICGEEFTTTTSRRKCCSRECNNKYRNEKQKNNARIHRQKHKEEMGEYIKEYRKEHKEEIKKVEHKYYINSIINKIKKKENDTHD